MQQGNRRNLKPMKVYFDTSTLVAALYSLNLRHFQALAQGDTRITSP